MAIVSFIGPLLIYVAIYLCPGSLLWQCLVVVPPTPYPNLPCSPSFRLTRGAALYPEG